MSVQSEIKTLAAGFIGEADTVLTTIETVLAKPAIAPFVPLIESAVSSVLTANGVPASQVETASVQIYTIIRSLLTAMETVNSVTPAVVTTQVAS